MTNEIFESVWKVMKENKFQSIDEINNDFICQICKKLMIKACNSHCGCRYCSDCIESYLDHTDKFCPGKGKLCEMRMINYEKEVFIDFPVNAKILEIIVKCPYKNCIFTGELSSIDNHMRICNNNPICCPYFEFGCKSDQVINNEMQNHLCTEIYCHTKLLLDFINNLRNEMESMKNEIAELKSINNHFNNELEKKQKSNEDLEKSMKIIQSNIENLKEENVKLKNENRYIMNKLENIEKSRVNEINEIEPGKIDNQKEDIYIVTNKIVEKNIEDEDLKQKSTSRRESLNIYRKMSDVKPGEGQGNILMKYKWNISSFSKQEELKDIHSSAFYSHKGGYRMCIGVRIDREFIDVYLYLLKGEFDNDLLWPFQYKITIEVINQIKGKVYTDKTISYNNNQNDIKWNKPTTASNEGIYLFRVMKTKEIIQKDKMVLICRINV